MIDLIWVAWALMVCLVLAFYYIMKKAIAGKGWDNKSLADVVKGVIMLFFIAVVIVNFENTTAADIIDDLLPWLFFFALILFGVRFLDAKTKD